MIIAAQHAKKKKGYPREAYRVVRCGGYLDNRLKDGGEVVSFTHCPCSTPHKNFVFLFEAV
jgi:hypothetical protein